MLSNKCFLNHKDSNENKNNANPRPKAAIIAIIYR